jgi:gluconate kinase
VHVWIFFGQAGAGKSFVARVCAAEFGFQEYEGDRDLTPEMQRALREHRLFTDDMRIEFTAALSRGIRERCFVLARKPNAGLAVCAALFKARDRKHLQSDFPEARMIWVRTPEALLEARLQKRVGHVASSSYAQLIKRGFESPEPMGDVLENDGDRARVVEQLRGYLR